MVKVTQRSSVSNKYVYPNVHENGLSGANNNNKQTNKKNTHNPPPKKNPPLTPKKYDFVCVETVKCW